MPRAAERRRPALQRLCLLAACLLLGACGAGAHLAGLQSDFEELYTTRVAMESGGAGRADWASPEDIDAALRSLSLEARQAAEDDTLQTPTRIALLRLAMIAGWQGKEPDTRYVASVASTGTRLCTDLGAQAPTRDCALFIIVPTAELSSRFPASYEEALSEARVNGNIPPARQDEVEAFFQGMSAVLASALDSFIKPPLVGYLDSHAGLLEYYRAELERYRGRSESARGFTFQIQGKPGGIASEEQLAFVGCAEAWIGDVLAAESSIKNPELRAKANECQALRSESR